jgi:hypothetical protein
MGLLSVPQRSIAKKFNGVNGKIKTTTTELAKLVPQINDAIELRPNLNNSLVGYKEKVKAAFEGASTHRRITRNFLELDVNILAFTTQKPFKENTLKLG